MNLALLFPLDLTGLLCHIVDGGERPILSLCQVRLIAQTKVASSQPKKYNHRRIKILIAYTEANQFDTKIFERAIVNLLTSNPVKETCQIKYHFSRT